MSKRYVCFQDAVRLILEERDKIPKTVPGMVYEFGLPQPNHSGNLIRGGIRKALKVLETMPKADAVEVVHAHWERYRDRTGLICSNCRREWHWFADEEYADIFARENKFCSNCGAKMDEETGE